MSDHLPPKLPAWRRVVVKVGTSSLTDDDGRIHPPRLWAIARGLLTLKEAVGTTPVLVSSGAGAAGRERLGLALPLTLPEKQAAAAVGQSLLMLEWARALAPLPVAQLLLSAGDVHERERYVNAKHALRASLKLGAVPVVNENDSVATAELRLGDNDTLSAWVAYLVEADALILLTDVDGVFDADPRRSTAARRVEEIDDLDAFDAAAVGGSGSERGTGGLATKLRAARIAQGAGIETRIVGGGGAGLEAVARGERVGTRIAAGRHLSARKAWLAHLPSVGTIDLDPGAVRALRQGRSLLPSGVTGCRGPFRFGDAVDLTDGEGTVVAHGLVNYDRDGVTTIAGHHTRDIASLLGGKDFDEIVHRDNLVLLTSHRRQGADAPAPEGARGVLPSTDREAS
ncbi:MAG: glutamate 5-kinase [Trueperaceae bacterium]